MTSSIMDYCHLVLIESIQLICLQSQTKVYLMILSKKGTSVDIIVPFSLCYTIFFANPMTAGNVVISNVAV